MTDADTAHDEQLLDAAYRERAHLIALLTRLFPSRWFADGEKDPEWPIIYIDTPAGQLSWHISRNDLHLFADTVPIAEANPWDGHDTTEKYRRLDALGVDPRLMLMKIDGEMTLVAPACADQRVPLVYNTTL